MNSKTKDTKFLKLLAWASATVVLYFLIIHGILGNIGGKDLIQYWSAAKAILTGLNPYSVSVLTDIQSRVLSNPFETLVMWNPPLIFPFIIVFGFLPFDLVRFVWILFSLALLFFVYKQNPIPYSSKKPKYIQYIKIFCIVTFFPAISCLYLGQASILLLFGFALYLYFLKKSRYVLAGLFLSITLIKPHILYLIYIHMLATAYQKRSPRLIFGFFIGSLTLALLPLMFNHQIYSFYFAAMSEPPIYWQTPTIGSFLQAVTFHDIKVRLFPSFLCAFFYSLWLFKNSDKKLNMESLFVLVPLSCVTSPYCWFFDQILLFPSLLWVLSITATTTSLSKKSIYALGILAVSHLALLIFVNQPQHFFIWYPITFLFASFLLLKENNVVEDCLKSDDGDNES